ncbi:hypothetical protein EVG20_g8801 [Dentipellis fragilis]|uniref:Uncharacterized protein n=1 Tax=Dentipellis fragilis TaxID=205917 RepID=A0A4Y9Y3I0_9AGAM|nr:hypothetical protein EVG20_g8801 [Dentipellis fragilis]
MAPVRHQTKYQRKRIALRALLRRLIRASLVQITGNPKARMSWTKYWRLVVLRYGVDIVGWPDDIPFMDPSKVSLGRTRLLPLVQSWEDGLTCFVKLTDAELAAKEAERKAKIAAGEIVLPAPRALRADFGDRRPHAQKGPAGRHCKKIFYSKSARFITASDELALDEEEF